MVVLSPRGTNGHINKLPSPKNFHSAFATIVDNPGIMPINARTLSRTIPIRGVEAPEQKGNHDKKPAIQVKQEQLNFMGIISIRKHLPTFVLYFRISGRSTV
jgi:hypothetical protein